MPPMRRMPSEIARPLVDSNPPARIPAPPLNVEVADEVTVSVPAMVDDADETNPLLK